MPVLEQLAVEYAGRARIVTVEADREGSVLERFGASSYPTYVVYRDGVEVDRLTLNFVPWRIEPRLRGMLDGALHE